MSSIEQFQFPAHALLREPALSFHPERDEQELHPLQGLVRFGPYSRSLLHGVVDPIRVGIIAPFGEAGKVRHLIDELERSHKPKERPAYLIDYPGFTQVFRIKVTPAQAVVELPAKFDDDLKRAKAPYVVLAEALNRALGSINAIRHEFDIVAIYLPDRWSSGFYAGRDDDFDLHDYLKAVMAARRIPTQIVREQSAIKYYCRCSVAWRLSIALYCKAGGVPWKMANIEPDTAYVGLSYALRQQVDARRRFVTCCSQVFDAEGSGLEFIAYETEGIRIERQNPYLSREEIRRVMTRTLSLYQRRHSGLAPRRVVVHKSTEFKADEVEGCFDALGACESIDLIQVQQDVAWRGVLINEPRNGESKGTPSGYPAHRGTAVMLDGKSVLLWTQGNAPSAVGGKDYYKEGKGIPMPLLLRRYAGHGPWAPACNAILGLTKMNWNNDSLYDRLPVTMAYAQVLANVVKRMPEMSPEAYQFRFFM